MTHINFDQGDHRLQKPRTFGLATKRSPKLPSRGIVLCIFDDVSLGLHIETQLVDEHFTLLRARHGMHAYWLAINSQPDLIVTDVLGTEASFMIECLQRNSKTNEIPLLGVVDSTQHEIAKLPLTHVTAAIRYDATAAQLREAADRLIAEHDNAPAQRSLDDHHRRVESVDAIFSEIGHAATRRPKIAPLFGGNSLTSDAINSNSM